MAIAQQWKYKKSVSLKTIVNDQLLSPEITASCGLGCSNFAINQYFPLAYWQLSVWNVSSTVSIVKQNSVWLFESFHYVTIHYKPLIICW